MKYVIIRHAYIVKAVKGESAMTLEEIRWIEELYRTGAVSKAAENLFISQPAMSQCLSRVEAQLGFRLFKRSNKGVVPTEKGELFYKMAKEVSASYERFRIETDKLDHRELTDITIGMPIYLASKVSTQLILRLRKAFPNVHFHVMEARDDILRKAFEKGEVQVIVVGRTVDMPDVTRLYVTSTPMVINLRNGSSLAQYAFFENGLLCLDPVYLEDEPISTTYPGQCSRYLSDRVFAQAGIKPNIINETHNVNSLLSNAVAGMTSSITGLSGEAAQNCPEGILFRIPQKYDNIRYEVEVLNFTNLDSLLPPGMTAIIRQVVLDSNVYTTV